MSEFIPASHYRLPEGFRPRAHKSEYFDDIYTLASSLRNLSDKIEKAARSADNRRKNGKSWEVDCVRKHRDALHAAVARFDEITERMA